MSRPRIVNEAIVRTDFNEIVHSLAREFAMACKKMAIYNGEHPVAKKAVERAFFLFGKIFQFKRYINLDLRQGFLYLLNIRLKETVFNTHLIQFMQLRDVNAILFEEKMSLEDFILFVDHFVKRVPTTDPYFQLSRFLDDKNIRTIEVNSELGVDFFENGKIYRGEVNTSLTARQYCLNQLPADIRKLVDLTNLDPELLIKNYIDFYPEYIKYLLPEKAATIPIENISATLRQLTDKINDENAGDSHASNFDTVANIFKLIGAHPDRDVIMAQVDSRLKDELMQHSQMDETTSETGKIRIGTRAHIEGLLEQFFQSAGEQEVSRSDFEDAFQRLLKTGQQGKACEIVNQLMDYLSNSLPEVRITALELLVATIRQLNLVTDRSVLESLVNDISKRLALKQETYEYSEIISEIFKKCFEEKRFDLMAKLTETMAERKKEEQGVTVFDSATLKKSFENINSPRIINLLLEEMKACNHESSQYVREILIAIGSEEIAMAISQIISHPIRQVRQQSLKVLAELGKASLRVFSSILMDDTLFERPGDRHELPDNKWYVLRNSIFVLGSLQDEEGLVPLRLRLSDKDIRIRREIVSALEKIKGEEAVDLLILMAEDSSEEIRNAAISAIGIIGTPDAVPLLIDVARRNPHTTIRVISVMGKLGGSDAHAFLSNLLDHPEQINDLTKGIISRDVLYVAVIRALGNLGDMESLKKYQSSLSSSHKLFFRNSPIQKALAEYIK